MFKISKHTVKRLCFLAAIVVLLSVCMSVTVLAYSSMSEVDDYAAEQLKDPIKFGVYTLTKWSVASSAYIVESCEFIFVDGGAVDSGFLATAQASLLVTGKLICFLYFLLDLMEHATRDTFTAEALIKSFAKLMIMFVLFDNVSVLTDFASDFNAYVVGLVGEGNKAAAYDKLVALIDNLKKNSWLKCLGVVLQNAVPGLTIGASLIVAFIVGIGRTIRIGIYNVMFPIGVAPIYNGGVNSSGFRYIKKFVALHLQGAIMYAALVVASNFGVTRFNLGPFTQLADLVIALATAAVIVKSKSIADDIVGV